LFRLHSHKIMKKVAIVFAVLICIILLVLLALEYVIDLNPYIPRITKPMEDALHRKVELGGISLSLLRGPGAKVQEISIFEQDQSSLFVQVKDIVTRVKLLPLLSKKIEVAKILLDEPIVTIKRNREGGWNFDDLLGKSVEASPQVPEEPAPSTTPSVSSSETPAPEATPEETPETSEGPEVSQSPEEKPSPISQFAVDTFQLNDGTVRFVDEMMNVTTEVSAITGDVKGISVNSPIRFQISADVDGGKQGKVKASGEIGPIPADGNIDNLDLDVTAKLEEIDLEHFSPYYQQQVALNPEKLNASIQLAGNLGKQLASNTNASVGEVKVDVSGTVEEVKTSPKVDLTISLPDLPWEKLLEILPPDVSEQIKDLGLTGIGNIKIQPKGSLDDLAISGDFDLSKSGIQYQRLFAKPEAMAMGLTFETAIKSMNSVDVSSLKLTLGDLKNCLLCSLKSLRRKLRIPIRNCLNREGQEC
jgi:AsmA protein